MIFSSSTALSVANCLGAQTAPVPADSAVVKAEEGQARAQEAPEGPEAPSAGQGIAPAEDRSAEVEAGGALSASSPMAAGPAVEEEEEEETEEAAKETEAELEAGDNSEQLSSSSTSTKSAKSGSEASASASKEALQAMILSLPRYHCENPASCKSPTLSTDTLRKRLYRIGLNLFNM